MPGLSSIVLTFEPGTDVLRARQLVQERLTLSFAIPNVAKPPIIIQPLSTTNRVMMVGLSSTTISPIEMGVLARWNIRPALLAVPGVANVAIWGQRERQLQVQVQPQKLLAANVTLDQIVRTTGNAMWVSPLTFLQASTPGSGGWIDTPSQRLEVRHIFPISTAADLSKVGVDGAAPLKLSDVANVVADHQPLIGDALLTGNEDSLIVIEKFPGANTLEVTRGVEAALDKLRPGLAGVDIDTSVSRPATYIDDSISDLEIAVIIGAVLLIAALGVLLHGWRSGLIAVVAIPISMAAALLVLDLRGETVNLMIVAGLLIALAILVDDAVACTQTIAARVRADREEGRSTPAQTLVLEGAVLARRGILYATLIAILPLLPYLFSEGVHQAVAEPLVISFLLAVVASLIVSVTVTPALSMLLLTHGHSGDGAGSPLLGRLRGGYTPLVERVVRAPRPAFLASGAVLVLALAAAPFFTQAMLPSFHDRNLVVRWNAAPGTSQPEMARLTARVGNELRSIPGVDHVGAHLGRAVLGDQVVDVNSAELWVTVKGSADYGATVEDVKNAVSGYPGVSENVSTYLDDRVKHFDTGTGKDITVRVAGPAFGTLRATADHVRDMLSKVDGVSDLQVEEPPEQPNIEVEVNLAKAKVYGLKPGDVRRAAATMLAGLEVGSLFEEQKVFQVVVWSTPDSRSSITSIKNLLIDTPSGGHVRLEDVAHVRISPTPTVIQRDAVSRRIDIGLNANGRDPGAVVADIDHKLATTQMPLEYHAEVIGSYQTAETLHQRMFASGIAAIIGIFLLLQAAFSSWRLAALFTLTLPVSLSGGVLAAFLFRADMTLATLAGFLAVLAVAARAGIALLTRAQALEVEDARRTRATAVVQAAGERLGPILTTAIATMVALVPLIVTGTIPGQEIAQPIAIVVFGGLITATLVTVFLVPAIYAASGPRPARAAADSTEPATT